MVITVNLMQSRRGLSQGCDLLLVLAVVVVLVRVIQGQRLT
jgi:hypothetical protein